jgi:nanoRNase/pAp phosphatase (c-di-AMP/oligoRNAs hydrolase)
MSNAGQADAVNAAKIAARAIGAPQNAGASGGIKAMTAFVESCVDTVAGSAQKVERIARRYPHARKLLKALAGKNRILITTHLHPDPDGLSSALALKALLNHQLPQAEVSLSVKGHVGGGLNEAFVRYSELDLVPWDESSLSQYDAIVLVDTQPSFAFSPLPPGTEVLAVIDHHPRWKGKPRCQFLDIRNDVGATASIVFSYLMETETPITPLLAATLLYGIETDVAGSAGTPTELDNVALSSLTLLADTRQLYKMRYVDLPRSYYVAYSQGLATARYYDNAMVSHLQEIDSLEKPAVLADFLLRFDQVDCALVTAIYENKLLMSLRIGNSRHSAGQIMRKLIRRIGQGGGHRAKAGGCVTLQSGSEAEATRVRTLLTRRLLRALGIKQTKGTPLAQT